MIPGYESFDSNEFPKRKVLPNGIATPLSTVDDVLLFGYGAMGAMCEPKRKSERLRFTFSFQDSFGLAHVTAIARRNFDIVKWIASVHPKLDLIPNCLIEEGTHIHSEKYGDIKGWKPYRGS